MPQAIYKNIVIHFFVLIISFTTHKACAIPLNGLLAIPSNSFHSQNSVYYKPRLTIESSYDFVTDNTNYEGPVRNAEPISSTSIKRYEGLHIIGDFSINDDLSVNFGFWNRQLANKRDILDFHTLQAALQYKLPWHWFNNDYAIRFGWWRDMADVFTKSSYTHTDEYKITSLVLNEPVDNQYQLNFLLSRNMDSGKQATVFFGIGYSTVNYKSIQGELTDEDGCEFDFTLEKTMGAFNQIGRCGNIVSRKIIMPNTTSITNNLGFNPRDNIEYNSLFFQAGAGAAWNKGLWTSKVGYYFQRFFRNSVDQRIEEEGNQSFRDNHSLTLEVAYRFYRPLSLFLRGEYVTSRLLTMAPFTYNTYTADRFSEDGLFLSIGLKLLL